MANLHFPQLSSGAQVQYPLRKRRTIRTVANSFADGSMIGSPLNRFAQHVWQLAYSGLTAVDQSALQNHFAACQGQLLPFTFIDPTDNMIGLSSNVMRGTWRADPQLSVTAGAADPMGGTQAFLLVNDGQIDQKLSQTIPAQAAFHYCLSVFARADAATSVSLMRSALSEASEQFAVGSDWRRLVHSTQLGESADTFTIAISVPAGQSLVIFAPQLEPQIAPSRYRATAGTGGIYPQAHFLDDAISFEADAPGLFSTVIKIETT